MRPRKPVGRPLGSTARVLHVGGRARSYRLFRPPGLAAGSAPLVLVLHGGFGSGGQAEWAYGWDDVAGRQGFLVAYPDGVGRSWNAGACCGPARREGVDDVGFLAALIAEVSAAEGVDADRVFATGISNGAMMAYRLACDLPGTLAAIGPVAGAMVCDCSRATPTSVLHIHGLDDNMVLLGGGIGPRAMQRLPRPPVSAGIEVWRRAAGCGPPRVIESRPVRTETASAPGGVEVALITIAGAGHQWPGARPAPPGLVRLLHLDQPSQAMDATAVLWSFFCAHPRPARTP